MYDKFSDQAKQIIIRSHKYALGKNEYVVGTEYLLLSLFNEPNSSCQILFKEINVDEEELLDAIEEINVFRKNIPGLIIYTPKFRSILDKANDIAKLTHSDFVYEEHLFYALLTTNDCMAQTVLNLLEVDIEEITHEIIQVMGWSFSEKRTDPINLDKFPFVENITKLVKADKLLPLIGRKNIIDRIIHILNKKNKRNVILIGNAGVGKSAIVEGLAQKFYKENVAKEIISLNITSLLAGTKYRGDFEQRIKDFLDAIVDREEIIVFIDEIHNIINIGNGDSNLDVANILKPALARGEINCIGATTIDEYYRHIASDAALSRRFLPIFVDEPTLEETIHILSNIKSYYEEFHQIKIPEGIVPYLCEKVEKGIINRYFPDKAIDVLDEACSYAKVRNCKEIDYSMIDHIIQTLNNQQYSEQSIKRIEQYPFLKRYFFKYYSNIKTSFKPIVSLLCEHQTEPQLDYFLNDLLEIFNIRNEAIKKINLNHFTDEHSISNLIGSPPGYVGFDNPNTLTKFVQKYPRSLILIKNMDHCANNVTQLFKDILNTGYIEDLANNKIYFTNTIIVATKTTKSNSIGFINSELHAQDGELSFNEKINLNHYVSKDDSKQKSVLNQYIFYFKTLDIDLIFEDYDMIQNQLAETNYIELENLLFECLFHEHNKQIFIEYNKEKDHFLIKKS